MTGPNCYRRLSASLRDWIKTLCAALWDWARPSVWTLEARSALACAGPGTGLSSGWKCWRTV